MALTALKVRGPFRGPGGYDHHVREFVRELHRQGVAVELIDLPEWGPARLPAHLRDPWFDSLTEPTGARIMLHFCMPHQVVPDAKRLNVNYTMFEATRIPPGWVAKARSHDLVVLPTESSRRAWIDSGVPEEQLRLCPLGINPSLFSGPVTPLPLQGNRGERLEQYKVRFLNVSELGPRKNLFGLLRAWLRATSRHDDAVLIVKLGCYQPGCLAIFRRRLELLQDELGKRLNEAAPVHFIYDLFSDADMPKLYAAATHYISMSFGEGWDQSMVEAAASGLQLIAPNHSAYTAYLDSAVAQLITSREVPAVVDGDVSTILFAGANWWEPDEDEAIRFIRAAIDGRDGATRSARDRILREFTWEIATRRLMAILGEAEARRRRPGFWPLHRWYRRA
jgi:glycosyltransferase involved in cell wall biosynthesis